MEKWICKMCGYTHMGEDAPERCPECGCTKFKYYSCCKGNGGKKAFIVLCIVILLTVIFFNFYACQSTLTVDNTAVSSLDLKRYLGKWYEIARFDHKFERGQTHCMATYTLQPDGMIKITNQGKKDGKWNTSVGKGKLTDHPGILRVSFFGPFYSDYRVMMLAPDYSYALVGGDDDKFLWILSRTPTLDSDKRDMLLKEARNRGYKTENLIWVEQGLEG